MQDFDRPSRLLTLALEAAVPLWLDRYRDATPATLERIARDAGAALAERGDLLMFRSKKRGQTAEVFNAVASGIAAAALLSGQDWREVLRKLWGPECA